MPMFAIFTLTLMIGIGISREESWLRRFQYDLLLFFFLILGVMGWWLNHHPISLEAKDDRSEGILPPQVEGAEVLLLIPQERKVASEFVDMDFSFAWYNALSQEVGPFKWIETQDFQVSSLTEIEMLVIPARATRQLKKDQIQWIESFVRAGGDLILEMPGSNWAALTGIKQVLQSTRMGKRITAAPTSPLQRDFGELLLEVPLHTRLLRMDMTKLSELQRSDILLEIDGMPVHIHRKLGEGHVYILGFNFGMAITALQQGLPGEGLKIPALDEEKNSDLEAWTRPDRLVADPKLMQSMVPYADLLERHVFYAPLRYRPAPRIWIFPELSSGALIMTHNEKGFGDASLYMADYEHQQGFKSTYLISPTSMSNEGLDRLRGFGATLGLAWHRDEAHAIYRPKGFGRLKPYRQALNLIEQKSRLEHWAGERLYAVRTLGQYWDRGYTDTFGKMVHAGFYIDASYGPTEWLHYGYLFGTGLPFFPIDLNGALLPIYEMPFEFSDISGFGPDKKDMLARLIKESHAGFHQCLGINIDADTMKDHPKPETLEQWMRSFELARSEGHWITTLHNYILFYDGRRKVKFRSHFAPKMKVLSIDVNLPELQTYTGEIMPPPSIGVPSYFQGNAIESVHLDDEVLETKELGRTGDGVLTLIPVSHGKHHLEVHYLESRH